MDVKRGDTVEVMIKDEGFKGSYFPATLLSKVGKDQFLVEYQTLCTEDDQGKMLREIVDAKTVRSFPPKIEVSDFSVLDVVDAYANDGWWVGKISGISSSMYYVYFEHTKEEIAYPIYKLRVHQELVDGKWVVSSCKKVMMG